MSNKADETPTEITPIVRGGQGREDHEVESGVFLWGAICSLLAIIIVVSYIYLFAAKP